MTMQKFANHLENRGGIFAQADAVRHTAKILSEKLESDLLGGKRPRSEPLSAQEVEIIIWMAAETAERAELLRQQIDALYHDLVESMEQQNGRLAA